VTACRETGATTWCRRACAVLGLLGALAGNAVAQQPGPAPIVISGGAGQAIRVRQGGQERVVDPAATRSISTARVGSSGSAFAVPEETGEPDGAQDEAALALPEGPGVVTAGAGPVVEGPFARGYSSSSSLNERMGRSTLVVERPHGYQPSSQLSQRLTPAGVTPFSQGYQPSSTLSDRMVAGAVGATTAWAVGDVSSPADVTTWSARGEQSREQEP